VSKRIDPYELPEQGRKRADDDDYELPIEALSAHLGTGTDTDLQDVLLSLIGDTAKLHALLAGADEDAFKEVRERLDLFFAQVEAIPRTPKAKAKIGFKRKPRK
jgi:hypothetical protein